MVGRFSWVLISLILWMIIMLILNLCCPPIPKIQSDQCGQWLQWSYAMLFIRCFPEWVTSNNKKKTGDRLSWSMSIVSKELQLTSTSSKVNTWSLDTFDLDDNSSSTEGVSHNEHKQQMYSTRSPKKEDKSVDLSNILQSKRQRTSTKGDSALIQ